MYSQTGSIKEIFEDDMNGKSGSGQFFEGWLREPFEIMDETLRLHTESMKLSEFRKEIRDQDPDFGITPLSQVLMRTSNEVRYLSQLTRRLRISLGNSLGCHTGLVRKTSVQGKYLA